MSISDTPHVAGRRAVPRSATQTAGNVDASPLLKWSVWLGLISVLYSEVTGSSSITTIGSYNLTVADPLLIVAAFALVTNVSKFGLRANFQTFLVILFSAVFAFNFISGFLISQPAALLSLRGNGLFAIFLLIGAIGDRAGGLSRTFEQALLPISMALCALVALRLIFGVDLFIYVTEISAIGVNDGDRPLSTFGATILGVTAVFRLSRMIHDDDRSPANLTFLILVIVAILLTGQGTATICSIVGLSIVLMMQPGRQQGLRIAITLGLLFILLIIVMATPAIDSGVLASMLPEDMAKNLMRRSGNHQTRLQAWRGILTSYGDADPVKQLIGWPAGTTPYVEIVNRKWGRVVWNVSAHSMYIGTLITHGAIGAATFVVLLLVRLGTLMREYFIGGPRFAFAARLIALLIMVAVFSYSYDLRTEGGLMLAVTLIGASAFTQRTSRVPGATTDTNT